MLKLKREFNSFTKPVDFPLPVILLYNLSQGNRFLIEDLWDSNRAFIKRIDFNRVDFT